MGRKRKRARGVNGRGEGVVGASVLREVAGKRSGQDPGILAEMLAGEAGGDQEKLVDVSSQVLRQVGMEVLREQMDPAAWARALVVSRGSRDDTFAHYARFRLEALAEEELESKGKKTSLEERRRESFRDFRSVPVMWTVETPERKATGFMDSLFWHMVGMVGMLGCLLAAGLIWPELKLDLSWQGLVLVVVGMQLIPLGGWWAGRGGQCVSYARAAQMAACLTMFGSLALGFNLLLKPSEEQSRLMAREGHREADRKVAERQSGRLGVDDPTLLPASPGLVPPHDDIVVAGDQSIVD